MQLNTINDVNVYFFVTIVQFHIRFFADLFDAAAYMFVLLLFFADRYTNFGTYVDFIYIFYSQKYPVDTSFKL